MFKIPFIYLVSLSLHAQKHFSGKIHHIVPFFCKAQQAMNIFIAIMNIVISTCEYYYNWANKHS